MIRRFVSSFASRLSARTLLVAVVFTCLGIALRCAAADGETLEARLLEVLVTYQEPDPFLPWQNLRPGTKEGYGILIGNNRVLTSESLVRGRRLVELRKPRGGEKIAASVEIADPQIDLAILRVADGAFPCADKPVPLAERIDPQGEVHVLQTDDTGQLQRGAAKVLSVQIDRLPLAPHAALVYHLLVDINVRGAAAPVVLDGGLAGLILAYNRDTRIATMLPVSMLRRFIDDTSDSPYQGFAGAGFSWRPLLDPAHRAYLGVASHTGGIHVVACMPGTGADASLDPDDVILAWDGYDVDNQGFYQDPELGRLSFAHLVKGLRAPGDRVPVRIVRDRQEIAVETELMRIDDDLALIPENLERERPEYLVEGGLVLRELDAHYLRAHGADWYKKIDPRLAHLYLARAHRPARRGERVVLLTAVLPDPVNIGYQGFRNMIVTAVNGREVGNMSDVFAAVDAEGHIFSLTLQSVGVDIVLNPDELDEANARLQDLYRIPALRHQASGFGSRETQ